MRHIYVRASEAILGEAAERAASSDAKDFFIEVRYGLRGKGTYFCALHSKKVRKSLVERKKKRYFAPRNHHNATIPQATPSGIGGLLRFLVCNNLWRLIH
jgi:hypothetical protein